MSLKGSDIMMNAHTRDKIHKYTVATILGLLIVLAAIMFTGCATAHWDRPLSGCERIALAKRNEIRREGKECYVAWIRYNNRIGKHAVVYTFDDDGKFVFYDPTFCCYPDRMSFHIEYPMMTKDNSCYGDGVNLKSTLNATKLEG